MKNCKNKKGKNTDPYKKKDIKKVREQKRKSDIKDLNKNIKKLIKSINCNNQIISSISNLFNNNKRKLITNGNKTQKKNC